MKIAQVNNCHYRRGGADVVYLNTIELLANRDITTIAISSEDPKNLRTKAKEFFVPKPDYRSNSLLKKMASVPPFIFNRSVSRFVENVLRVERPDLVHFHSYKGTFTTSTLLACKKLNIPIVFTLHDYGLLCPHNTMLTGRGEVCERCPKTGSAIHCITNRCNSNKLTDSIISAAEFHYSKKIANFYTLFDSLIAPSSFIFNKHYSEISLRGKISQIVNFNEVFSKPNKNDLKRKFQGPIVYIGRLAREKGLSTLIQAYLKSEISRDLIIVGDGSEGSNLKSRYQNCPGIKFLGFQEKKQCDHIVRSSSCVIVPSEWYENNPLSIIESLSQSTPVFATDIGGIPELVKHKHNGFLFPPGDSDSLTKLLREFESFSLARYEEMVDNAFDHAKEMFSPDLHYRELKRLYAGLL